MTANYHLNLITEALKKAVENRDKEAILRLYDEAKEIDMDEVSDSAFQRYDDTVDLANDLVLEEAA